MLFKKKSSPAPLPSVRVLAGERVLYEGKLKDIPLKETVILEKSVHFFNDPEPCYIHRGAVRVRLTEELHQELLARALSSRSTRTWKGRTSASLRDCYFKIKYTA